MWKKIEMKKEELENVIYVRWEVVFANKNCKCFINKRNIYNVKIYSIRKKDTTKTFEILI